MKARSFIIGLTAGIVGGATAIIFTAPQSGEQLRSNLARNTASAKDKLNDVKAQATNVKHSFTTLSYEVKNNIPQIINELKDTFTNFRQDIDPGTAKLQQEIENLQKSIAEIEKNLPQDRK